MSFCPERQSTPVSGGVMVTVPVSVPVVSQLKRRSVMVPSLSVGDRSPVHGLTSRNDSPPLQSSLWSSLTPEMILQLELKRMETESQRLVMQAKKEEKESKRLARKEKEESKRLALQVESPRLAIQVKEKEESRRMECRCK